MTLRRMISAVALISSLQAGAAQLSAQGTAELDRYLQDAIGTTHIPGMVALVVDSNGILYEKGFGLMDKAQGEPMSADAIFRLASMTKAITSTSIMMLVEEGKVDLDAPASKYLPALANPRVITSWNAADGTYTAVPAKNAMTVRQLLTHTSGLGYGFTSDITNKLTNGNFGVRATSFPLMFEPGTQWLYGESTAVLGEIVEAVSGKEQFAFMQERLLGPLKMTDTTFDVAAGKSARVVTVHQRNGSSMTETPNPPGVISAPHRGDGGLSATARDYSKFIQMFLNDGRGPGGARLLKPATVKLMGQNHTAPVKVTLMHSTNKLLSEDFPLGAGVDSYALGFQRTEAQVPGMRSVGSLAWAGIYNTEFWIDRKKGIGAVLLMQYLPFYDADAIKVLQGFESRVYRSLN
jgi:methyl acetate hydrolase